MHTVVAFPTPSRGGPYIAVHVTTDAVGGTRRHVHKHAPLLQSFAIHNVINPNRTWVAGMFRRTAVHDVKQLLVGREAQAVGLIEIAGNNCRDARLWVEPVDVSGKFESSFVPFVIRHNAIAGVAEPDGPVRMNHHVVRGVELLALKAIHQHRDGATMLSARHTARVVLAGDQSPLAVAAIPIAVVRGTAEYSNFSRFLKPSQHTVVGNVAEDQVSSISNPHRTLRPAGAREQPLNPSVDNLIFRKPGINDLHRWIGIDGWTFRFGLTNKSGRWNGQSHCRFGRHAHEFASFHRPLQQINPLRGTTLSRSEPPHSASRNPYIILGVPLMMVLPTFCRSSHWSISY